VIAVDMGIDEKANRLVPDLLDSRDQPLDAQRFRKLEKSLPLWSSAAEVFG